jgi:hypothetical protein
MRRHSRSPTSVSRSAPGPTSRSRRLTSFSCVLTLSTSGLCGTGLPRLAAPYPWSRWSDTLAAIKEALGDTPVKQPTLAPLTRPGVTHSRTGRL